MRRKAPFTQTDVTRMVKGVVAAGLTVTRVRVEDGVISVDTSPPDFTDVSNHGPNPWDLKLEKRRR